MSRRAIRAFFLALVVQSALPGEARAQAPDPSVVSAARALAEEAFALYDKGQYPAALDKFNRADELVHAPTMGLGAARCLERSGHWVAAAERYRAVSRVEPGRDASEAFKQAVSDAAKEGQALLAKIPKLRISIAGAPPGEVSVTLDGAPVPAALLGLPRPTDPGHHRLTGARGTDVAVKELDLAAGDDVAVTLELTPAAARLAPVPPQQQGGGSTQRVIGWVGLGVGAVGLVVGGATLGVVLHDRSALVASHGCTNDLACMPPATQAQVNGYNTVRSLPTAGFVVGGVGVAVGAVLLLTAPRARPPLRALRLQPWLGPDGAGVTGVF